MAPWRLATNAPWSLVFPEGRELASVPARPIYRQMYEPNAAPVINGLPRGGNWRDTEMGRMKLAAWIRRLCGPLLMFVLLGACEPAGEVPTVLRIGVLPDQSREALERRYAPLFAHLSATVGIEHKLIVPRDYGHLLALFHEGRVDLAYFGGLTFLRARRGDGAVPIVMGDVDARFVSYFLVRTDNTAASLTDLKQKSLAFGPRLSTSGHLMPRHFLVQKGFVPEKFFAMVRHSTAHDETAYMVRDGVVDAGAVNGAIVQAMFADGRLSRDAVRILWQTPPYPDYVWAMRKGISEKVRRGVQDAFLALSMQNPSQAAILARVGIARFLPVTANEFELLSGVANQLGLLDG